MKNLLRILCLFGALFATAANAQGIGQLQAGQTWGNPTGSQALGQPTTVGALMDQEYTCTAQGSIVYRSSAGWVCLAPGTSGFALLSQGASANLHWAAFAASQLSGTTLASGVVTSSLTSVGTLTGGATGSGFTIALGSSTISGQLGYANGGCNGTSQATCTNNVHASPTRAGDVEYWNGSSWVTLAGNNSGTQVLQETASGVPSWATVAGTGTVTSVACGTGLSCSPSPIVTSGTITNAGVTSIASNTGAFTLGGGITNSTNQIQLSLTNTTLQASPGNPTGTTSSTGVMMGLGSTCHLTPTYSSRVKVEFLIGSIQLGATDGITTKVFYGSGVAPSNGVASTGTQVGNTVATTSASASNILSMMNGGIITGLTPGTAYWFDLDVAAVTGGTASPTSISCNAMEF